MLAITLADLVKKIERCVAHLADAHPDLDRLHLQLQFEVAFRSSDDESDVASSRAAGELEPELRSRPLEVSEKNCVIDVPKTVKVAEQDLVRHHVPAIHPPGHCLRHHVVRSPHCTLPLCTATGALWRVQAWR